MSVELRDIRAKVTAEADIALEVECATTGKDKSELVREILQHWAMQRIHAANVLARRLKAEGIAGSLGELQGVPGSPRESQGTSGNRREAA